MTSVGASVRLISSLQSVQSGECPKSAGMSEYMLISLTLYAAWGMRHGAHGAGASATSCESARSPLAYRS